MTPEQEVLEAARAIIDASNSGTIEGAGPQDIISTFAANGGLLNCPSDNEGPDDNKDTNRPSAWHFSHWKHPQVHVEGDMAFLTGYLEGHFVMNGERTNFSWRDTCIFAKRSGQWTRIHFHTSPLSPGSF
jgi:hypothetical protein